jgi:hypothetical protein
VFSIKILSPSMDGTDSGKCLQKKKKKKRDVTK